MSASRASDEDREQVAEGLRADLLEGRLTVDEYERRLGQAYRACTVEELQALVADLPDWYVPSGEETRRRRPLFGIRSFSVRIESQKPPAVVVAEAMRTIGPHLMRSGYSMERKGKTQLVFTRERRPAWTILVAIFLFPFGLLALTHKARESQVFVNAIAVREGETLVDVVGVAPAGVRRALLELER
jgi:Domain of unknown function (DUF1707)